VPVVRVRQATPLIDMASEFVDIRCRVVLLVVTRQPFAFVEHHLLLCRPASPFPRLWNRSNELRSAATLDDALRRLPVAVQLPMSFRTFIRRVEDRARKELFDVSFIRHCGLPLSWVNAGSSRSRLRRLPAFGIGGGYDQAFFKHHVRLYPSKSPKITPMSGHPRFCK